MESMRVHAGRIRRLARRAQWQAQQQDGRSRLRGSEDGAIRMVRSCHFGTGVAGCYSGATSQGEARQRGSQAWRLPDDGSVNEYCKYILKSEMRTHTLARTTSHNDGDIRSKAHKASFTSHASRGTQVRIPQQPADVAKADVVLRLSVAQWRCLSHVERPGKPDLSLCLKLVGRQAFSNTSIRSALRSPSIRCARDR